jgi:hypothetical protein
MSKGLEHATETLEHAHHLTEHGAPRDTFPRNVAILVAFLAAVLAIAEIGGKAAQNAYLTFHVTASDDWAFYQAKNIRSNMYSLNADLLESLAPAADPALRKKIDATRAEAKRLDDDEKTTGRKQAAEKARRSEEERDHAFHRYHRYELVVGALQIAIVLSSVAIVSRVGQLAWLAGVVGAVAGLGGLAIAFNLFS